jgi:hypothetical protein
MNLTLQVTLLAIIAVMATHTLTQRRGGRIATAHLVVWLAIWIGGAVVVAFPDFATRLATRLHIGRGADLVIYVSIPVLFYIVFRLLVRIERLNRDVTELTRALAIESQRREEATETAAT